RGVPGDLGVEDLGGAEPGDLLGDLGLAHEPGPRGGVVVELDAQELDRDALSVRALPEEHRALRPRAEPPEQPVAAEARGVVRLQRPGLRQEDPLSVRSRRPVRARPPVAGAAVTAGPPPLSPAGSRHPASGPLPHPHLRDPGDAAGQAGPFGWPPSRIRRTARDRTPSRPRPHPRTRRRSHGGTPRMRAPEPPWARPARGARSRRSAPPERDSDDTAPAESAGPAAARRTSRDRTVPRDEEHAEKGARPHLATPRRRRAERDLRRRAGLSRGRGPCGA